MMSGEVTVTLVWKGDAGDRLVLERGGRTNEPRAAATEHTAAVLRALDRVALKNDGAAKPHPKPSNDADRVTAAAQHFRDTVDSVRGAMASGKTSAGGGLKELQKLMERELSALGISVKPGA